MGESLTMPGPATALSRRGFLRAGLATSIIGLGGCGETDTGDGVPSSDESSVFTAVTVDASDLVVELRDDHDVSEVTLVEPDGSLYARHATPSGVTTVRFQLIALEHGRAEHYTPGTYELVAHRGDDSTSQEVELRPELAIRDISQSTDDEIPAPDTRIAVVVENIGTAPTWVYDVVFENAPNWAANDKLGTRPGIPHLVKPKELEELILWPNTSQTYVGANQPLRFFNGSEQLCSVSTETTIILGTAGGEPMKRRVLITAGGQATSAGTGDGFTCSDVSVELLSGGSQSATSVRGGYR